MYFSILAETVDLDSGYRWHRPSCSPEPGIVIFIRALWVKPEIRMPDSLRAMRVELRALKTSASCGVSTSPGRNLLRPPTAQKKTGSFDPKQSRIAAAMLLAGDGRGLQSLSQHASQLTHVCVDMLTVSGQPARNQRRTGSDALSAAHAAKVQIFPHSTTTQSHAEIPRRSRV